MKDKVKNGLEIISIVVPAIITICSTILDKILDVEVWHILSIVFTMMTLLFSIIILMINIRKAKIYQKTISNLNQAIDFCCDGKRYLSNDAIVEFVKEDLSYKISICKKYEILSLHINYYSIYISCDKYPEDTRKSNCFYENQNEIWKNLNLQVSMVVEKNGKKSTFYNIYFEKVKEQSNHIYFKVFYKQKINNQLVEMAINEGDIVSITYSFKASAKYWGSYINRPIDFNKATTTVSFFGNYPKEDFTVITIDLNGNAKKIDHYKVDYDRNNTIIILPTASLSMNELKNCHFRIYWDANKIFDTTNLNSYFIGPTDPIWKMD